MAKIQRDYSKYNRAYQKLRQYKAILGLVPLALAFAFGTGAMLIWKHCGHNIDQATLRLFSTIHGPRPHPQEIIIVALAPEHASSGDLPRAEVALGLEKISAAQPSALIFNGVLPGINEDPNDSRRIAQALAAVPSVIDTGEIPLDPGESGDPVILRPLPLFRDAASFEAPLFLRAHWPMMAGPKFRGENYSATKDTSLTPQTLYSQFPLAQVVPTALLSPTISPPAVNDLINFYGPAGTIRRVTLQEVILGNSEFARTHFHNKLVFVGVQSIRPEQNGGYIRLSSAEFEVYAYNRPMFEVEVHANFIGNLIDRTWLRQLDEGLNLALIWLLPVLLFWPLFIHRFYSTRVYLFYIVPFLVIITVASYILFAQYNIWVSGVGVLWVMFLLSPLVESIYANYSLQRSTRIIEKFTGQKLTGISETA